MFKIRKSNVTLHLKSAIFEYLLLYFIKNVVILIYVIIYRGQGVIKMNILHLKYAVEVAKTGSLNKAAENLFMAQPNLSRAIKELESSLGITIFSRSPKGMVATDDGEEFLHYARKILSQIDEVEAIYKSNAPQKQMFSISVPRATYICEAFSEFSKKIDNTLPAELFYKETNAMRAIKNITDANYKLGILRYAENYDKYFKTMLEEKGLGYEIVAEFSYKIIMSKSHPLAAKSEISLGDLRPYTEIAHADPFVPSLPMSAVRREELPNDCERRIYVFERASQFELLQNNTETFMWVSPISGEMLDRYSLVQKKCTETGRVYKDVLIYRKDYKLTALDKLFINELCHAKRKYIKD